MMAVLDVSAVAEILLQRIEEDKIDLGQSRELLDLLMK